MESSSVEVPPYRRAEPVEVFEVTAVGLPDILRVEVRWDFDGNLKWINTGGFGSIDRKFLPHLLRLSSDLLKRDGMNRRAREKAAAEAARAEKVEVVEVVPVIQENVDAQA